MAAKRLLRFSVLTVLAAFLCDAEVKRSDDVNLQSLEALVQQQATLIQTLQTKLNAGEAKQTAMESRLSTVEAELHTLKAKEARAVAFSARFSGDNIALGTHSTLIFNRVLTNLGNGYSPQTGIFTAPADGLYAFFLSAMSHNSHTYLNLDIVKEGAILDLVYADGSYDMNDQGSSLVTTHLTTGQRVWVMQAHGDIVRGATLTIFTGFLVHAD